MISQASKDYLGNRMALICQGIHLHIVNGSAYFGRNATLYIPLLRALENWKGFISQISKPTIVVVLIVHGNGTLSHQNKFT